MNLTCCITYEILLDSEISPGALRLYLLISCLARKQGYCWASNRFLADKLNVEMEYVQECLARLEKKGYILRRKDSEGLRQIWCTAHQRSDGVTHQLADGPSHQRSDGVTHQLADGVSIISMNSVLNECCNVPNLGVEATPSSGATQQADGILPSIVVLAKYTKTFNHDSLPYQLSDAFLTLIEKGPHKGTVHRYTCTPEGRESKIQQLSYSMDLLLRKDARPVSEVLDVIEWCQKDKFWKGVILSTENLRKHYAELFKQKSREGFGHEPVPEDPNTEVTQEIIKAFRQLSHNPNYRPRGGEMTKFIQASARAVEFFKKRPLCERNMWSDLIIECLEHKYLDSGEDIYPGHMCSDFTWNILMPEYIAKTGLV